jgi:hypothetical protein
MKNRQFTVRCEWDPDAKVWFVADSNVPGLATEADSEQAMLKKLLTLIPELVNLNEGPDGKSDVPLELLWKRTQNAVVRLHS